MHVNRRTVVLFVPVMLVVAACGGSSNPTAGTTTSKPSAKQVLLTSVQRTTSQSFLADMSVVETITATGPAAAQFGALGGQPTTVSLKMSAQSAQRMRMAMTATIAGRPLNTVAVLYDGALYESSDGGATFKVMDTAGALPKQLASNNPLSYLQSVGSVMDVGPGTADGVAVERYSAQLDPAKVLALMKSAVSSVQSAQAQQLFSGMKFSAGTIQGTVDHQGRLVTENGAIDVSIDLGALSPSMAGTRMAIHETVDAHFHDYGKAVTVTKPPLTAG